MPKDWERIPIGGFTIDGDTALAQT